MIWRHERRGWTEGADNQTNNQLKCTVGANKAMKLVWECRISGTDGLEKTTWLPSTQAVAHALYHKPS